MVESRKTKHLLWIISLTLGPVVYCILLLKSPGTPNIEVIKQNLTDLVFTFIIYWAVAFGLVCWRGVATRFDRHLWRNVIHG